VYRVKEKGDAGPDAARCDGVQDCAIILGKTCAPRVARSGNPGIRHLCS